MRRGPLGDSVLSTLRWWLFDLTSSANGMERPYQAIDRCYRKQHHRAMEGVTEAERDVSLAEAPGMVMGTPWLRVTLRSTARSVEVNCDRGGRLARR
jgi:hypothetical protein